MAKAEPPWMKIELKTPDKTCIYAMAALLKKDADLVLGKLVRFWCWLDLHTVDEHTHMLPDSVDALVRCKGFADAMRQVGWAELADDGTVDIVRWGEHNGKGAKTRVQTAVRVANFKAGHVTQEQVKGNAAGVTKTLPKRDLEKEKEYKEGGVGKATLYGADGAAGPAEAEPAPPHDSREGGGLVGISDRFAAWLRALCAAHPSLRKSEKLAPDVQGAALGAFQRYPKAAEHAGLLTAYMDDRMQEDRNRKPFYRPAGQRKFFDNLEDVVSHAERWDRETGWSAKRKPKPVPPRPLPKVERVSDAERAAAVEEFRAMMAEDEEGGAR